MPAWVVTVCYCLVLGGRRVSQNCRGAGSAVHADLIVGEALLLVLVWVVSPSASRVSGPAGQLRGECQCPRSRASSMCSGRL